jgi:hypothetical protein
MNVIGDLNWLAIIVATIVAFMLGGLWFSPVLFANQWVAALGKTKEELGKPAPAMAMSFFTTLVTAISIAILISRLPNLSLGGGVRLGLLLGIGIYAAGTASDYAFTNWARKLFLIQAGYHVVMLVVMTVIITVWR